MCIRPWFIVALLLSLHYFIIHLGSITYFLHIIPGQEAVKYILILILYSPKAEHTKFNIKYHILLMPY